MYSVVNTAVLKGIESIPIKIEADISAGMPSFEMVGFLASEVKEAKERVRIALKNCGIELPVSRITVNFTPADIRKAGSSFDLAVTAALLSAMGLIEESICRESIFLGEIGLNGEVISVRGILSATILAKNMGYARIFVPEGNKDEAALISAVDIIPVKNIHELLNVCKTKDWVNFKYGKSMILEKKNYDVDFKDVFGQYMGKRACEIAASGMHNLLFVGPPGSGKSMLAKRIPTILPEMEFDEIMELSQIYSAYGYGEALSVLQTNRPFRAPHHTITGQGLCGGGNYPMPGEISLAHKGILFLDELPEFPKAVIDMLRQPMEDGYINIDRVHGRYRFPSEFVAVAAMNPCKCGFYPDTNRCRCTNASVQSYLNRVSQPILDRFDMTVETLEVPFSDLTRDSCEESSYTIRERVKAALEIQKRRFADRKYYFNSQMTTADLKVFCVLSQEAKAYLRELEEAKLSARAHFKMLKVSRTIADMDGADIIQKKHMMEAFAYRSLDKKYWKGV